MKINVNNNRLTAKPFFNCGKWQTEIVVFRMNLLCVCARVFFVAVQTDAITCDQAPSIKSNKIHPAMYRKGAQKITQSLAVGHTMFEHRKN